MVGSPALRAVGVLLIISGALLLLWALATGQASIALVIVVPVIYGSGPLIALAVLMGFAGMALLFLSSLRTNPPPETRPDKGPAEEAPVEPVQVKRSWGGVILIGPVPIVFGSAGALRDRRVLLALSILSLMVLALFILAVLG